MKSVPRYWEMKKNSITCPTVVSYRLIMLRITKTGVIALWTVLAAVLIVALFFLLKPVFVGDHMTEKPEPIRNDTHSLYILNPGPFEVVGPEYPIPREFLILGAGDVEISCGVFAGGFFESEMAEVEIAEFARETIRNSGWLPGCNRWMLDAGDVTIDDRWFYFTTLLIRRDPELSGRLTLLQRTVHEREFALYPDNTDRIVRVYYALSEKDIYIFTLSGPPEDIVAVEMDVRVLLASARFAASEAILEMD